VKKEVIEILSGTALSKQWTSFYSVLDVYHSCTFV